jgi:hypothetical protein
MFARQSTQKCNRVVKVDFAPRDGVCMICKERRVLDPLFQTDMRRACGATRALRLSLCFMFNIREERMEGSPQNCAEAQDGSRWQVRRPHRIHLRTLARS